MDHPALTSRHLTSQHCAHLRHKGMYVYGDLAPEAAEQAVSEIAATSYWCGCTQKVFGPDGEPVDARYCSARRSCCEH